jgi:hypothetical protein
MPIADGAKWNSVKNCSDDIENSFRDMKFMRWAERDSQFDTLTEMGNSYEMTERDSLEFQESRSEGF